MSNPIPSFTVRDSVDEPGIIGASWWQDGLDPIGRRPFLRNMLIAGGVLALGAAIASSCSSSSGPDMVVTPKGANQMQREFGWSFGAEGEPLVFDGQATQSFDRAALSRLAADVRPRSPRLLPFFVPTLFEALTATPTGKTEDSVNAKPLIDALRPIFTPAMDLAYRAGGTMASIVGARMDVAVLVDLPGPEAVAFVAGAAGALEPVFAFDNWPHPRGVVPAHRTLAALAYYQPLLAKTASTRRPGAPPIFALDRSRLAPYTDDAAQFDNRHLARIPRPPALASLGVKIFAYVVPRTGDVELDDLNDDLVAIAAAMKLYARSPQDLSFARPIATVFDGPTYAPVPRQTSLSSGVPGGTRPTPPGFGVVPVLVAAGTGVVLGTKFSRNGSLYRGGSTGG